MDNKIPINRMNRFFSESDFDLNISIGEEYLHGDLNMTLVLFRVDVTKTNIDDVYAEVGKDKIQFLPPIEFNGLVRIDAPKNDSYKDGLVRYLEPGNLNISVYIKHLEELGVDIKYGDYIGYAQNESKVRYYTVVNDGKVVSDNKHNMFGYKPYYRTITCSIAKDAEFRGI
jgi:hypothetical protein